MLCSDRGSDAHCGNHALAFAEDVKINCSLWWDNSHDAYRGVLEAIKKSGLYCLVVLLMVVINLDHGPDGTNMRYNQMLEVCQRSLPLMKPENLPLFKAPFTCIHIYICMHVCMHAWKHACIYI